MVIKYFQNNKGYQSVGDEADQTSRLYDHKVLQSDFKIYMHKRLVWFVLVSFYGISNIVGYLMPNTLYIYILKIYGFVW